MLRRTITIPEILDQDVRKAANEGESFSAAVARLLERGLAAEDGRIVPSYIGSGEGPGDLGINAEKYLAERFAEFEDS